jgi:regulator of replication initiation timing
MSDFITNGELRIEAERLCDENEKLKAENAKLRELVGDMSICMDNSKPHCKQCKFQELDCQWFKFVDRMRELGVEVEG